MKETFLLFITITLFLIGCSIEKPNMDNSSNSNMQARDLLLRRIGNINDFSQPRPLVTLEEFFTDNDDYASIGYNLSDAPSPQEFFKIFQTIRNRDDVVDIRVEVKDLEDPDGWPSTDTIWIITTSSADVVVSWLPDNIKPNDILIGFDSLSMPVETIHIPQGYQAIGIWYD